MRLITLCTIPALGNQEIHLECLLLLSFDLSHSIYDIAHSLVMFDYLFELIETRRLSNGSFEQHNIRIYHECEGRIEKSVPRIAVWHHEACRVMTNGDPEGRIFQSYPHTNNGIFFLLTTVLFIYLCIFKISFQKSLNTLRCNFT